VAGVGAPDVILVDAELPGDLGLATISRLRASLPTTRIVALGLYVGRRAAALAAGAHAFVLKDAGFDALRAAIVDGADEPAPLQAGRQERGPARTGQQVTGRLHAGHQETGPAMTGRAETGPARAGVESESASARTPRSVR
jgi:DNA-binding NarL/FixJ family response regulator